MSARSRVRRVPRWAWITVAVTVAAIIAVSVWTFGYAIPTQSASARTVVRTATAALRTMEQTVTATGTAAPAVQDAVDFAVPGTVVSVDVKAGDTVKKGQALAKVDTLQLHAAVLQAQATLAQARVSLASAQGADDGTGAAAARLAAASAAVDVDAQAVAQAKTAMSQATLIAPDAGLVTAVTIAVGDRVSGSGSPGAGGSGSGSSGPAAGGSATAASTGVASGAVTIVGTTAWTVDAAVGETAVSHVSVGEQVELGTADGRALFGVVSSVGLVPSTTTGSAQYPVTITVTGTGAGLFDGVSVTAAIVYQRRTDVLAVPSAAVTTTAGRSTVAVVGTGGAQTVTAVTVGEVAGGYTEITGGVKEGAAVIVASFVPGAGRTGTTTGRGGASRFPGGFTGGGFGGQTRQGTPGGGQ